MNRDPRSTVMGHTDPGGLFIGYGLTDLWIMPGQKASTRGEAPLPKDQWQGFHSARNRFLTLLAEQASERRLRAAHGEL